MEQNKEETNRSLCDRNTECLEREEWSPRSRAQMQRNIIISSPPK